MAIEEAACSRGLEITRITTHGEEGYFNVRYNCSGDAFVTSSFPPFISLSFIYRVIICIVCEYNLLKIAIEGCAMQMKRMKDVWRGRE